jgi:hypothetical protein
MPEDLIGTVMHCKSEIYGSSKTLRSDLVAIIWVNLCKATKVPQTDMSHPPPRNQLLNTGIHKKKHTYVASST